MLSYANILLSHSHNSAITISVFKTKAVILGHLQNMISVLLPHLSRCEHMTIVCTAINQSTYPRDPLADLLEQPTPRLRSLYTCGNFFRPQGPDGVAKPLVARFLLPTAPLLHTVTVRTRSNLVTWLTTPYTIETFIHLAASSKTTCSMQHTLYHCWSLRTLTLVLHCPNFVPPTTARAEIIDAPTLNQLTIRSGSVHLNEDAVALRFASAFDLPALTSLNLEGDQSNGRQRVIWLHCFSLRSTKITHLAISLSADHITHLIGVLPKLGSLTNLELLGTVFTQATVAMFFGGLSRSQADGTWICPKLTDLTTTSCSYNACDSGCMLNMVVLRSSAAHIDGDDNRPAVLQTVNIGWDIQEAVDLQLREYTQADAAIAEPNLNREKAGAGDDEGGGDHAAMQTSQADNGVKVQDGDSLFSEDQTQASGSLRMTRSRTRAQS